MTDRHKRDLIKAFGGFFVGIAVGVNDDLLTVVFGAIGLVLLWFY